jgi:putative FmdB family regulatory protein
VPILVDYQCRTCGTRAEHWAPSPPPASVSCGSCGAESRRLFAAVGLSGARSAPSEPPASSTRTGPTLCQQYPQIPGLCHMSESAGRMWVAKATRNSRAVDREQERQEKAAAVKAPTMANVITHQHRPPAAATAGEASTAPEATPPSG